MQADLPGPTALEPAMRLDGRDAWLHALRNELNTAMMSVAVARHLNGSQNAAHVARHLDRAQAACQRCGELLAQPPDPMAETLHDDATAVVVRKVLI